MQDSLQGDTVGLQTPLYVHSHARPQEVERCCLLRVLHQPRLEQMLAAH